MIQLIELQTILELVPRLHDRTSGMIFGPEKVAEAAEHAHDAQLVLAVRVDGAGVEDDVFEGAGGAGEGSEGVVAGPEVAVHEDGGDGAAGVEVGGGEEAGDDEVAGALDESAEGGVGAVAGRGQGQDGEEAVVDVEVRPGGVEGVGLDGGAAGGGDGEAEVGGLRVGRWGEGRGRGVEGCEFGGEGAACGSGVGGEVEEVRDEVRARAVGEGAVRETGGAEGRDDGVDGV